MLVAESKEEAEEMFSVIQNMIINNAGLRVKNPGGQNW